MPLYLQLQEDVAAFQANHTEILKEVSMMNGKVVQQLDDKLEEEHELLLRFAAFSEQFEIKHELVSITRSDRNSTNSQAQPGPHPSTNANQVPNTESMDKEWTMHSLIDSSKVGGNETDEAQTGTVSEIKDTLHGDGASNNSTQQLAESRDMSANEDTGASTSASFGGSNMTTINGNKQSQGSGAMQSSTHSHKHAPGGGDETDASPEPDGDKGN